MFVARRDSGLDEISEAFTVNGIDADKLMSNNSLLLVDNKEWYIPDEKVDKHRIIDQWNDLVNRSLVSGKKGLRAFCMMDTFFEHNFVEELVDYEHVDITQIRLNIYISYISNLNVTEYLQNYGDLFSF